MCTVVRIEKMWGIDFHSVRVRWISFVKFQIRCRKNPWLLGKMFESGFPHTVDGGVSPQTGTGEWITLSNYAGTRRGCVCVGECCSCSFCWMWLLGWGARSPDDVSHFLGGTCHGRCSRTVVRGLEMCALDGVSTPSLAGFGCRSLCRGPLRLDSRMGTDQGIYPWVSTR
jgi:hypothetical protein